jgi:putative addiction module component (TIGR02574 family)
MSPDAQRLLEEARKLPPDEREWLAEFLLIKDESVSAAEVEFAWGDEIKRRLDEIDSGAVEMIPGDEVMARMLDRLSPEARARIKK